MLPALLPQARHETGDMKPVAVVLGLGDEIGVATARAYRAAGHNVVVVDESAAKVERAREALGDGLTYHNDALHTQLGLRNCLAATREAFGRVDRVIYIPSIPTADTLSDVSFDAFDKALGRAGRGSAITLRLFSDQMRDQSPLETSTLQKQPQTGAMAFVLSITARLADSSRFSESVAQNAVLGVMRAGALALAPDKIRVNALVAVRPRAEREEKWLLQRTPLERTALADEIAHAALYLNSFDAAFMTGQILQLDGGRGVLNGIVTRNSEDI